MSKDFVFDCDPGKRALLLRTRGIDLIRLGDAIFDPRRFDRPDERHAYGEERRIATGLVGARLFTVVYVRRGPVTWLVTGWSSNRSERRRYVER